MGTAAGTLARVWEQAWRPWSVVPGAPLAARETSCPCHCWVSALPCAGAVGEPLAAERHSMAGRKPAPGAAVAASAGRPASIRPAALCLRVSQPVSALGESASRLPHAALPVPDSLLLPGRSTRCSTRRPLPSTSRGGVSPGWPDEGERVGGRGGWAGCRQESKVAGEERTERGVIHEAARQLGC